MRRRDFIALSGAAMAAGSVGVGAQQGDRPKRIGILYSAAPDDPQLRVDREVLVQRLAQNGWTDGRNVNIEVRAASGNPDYFRKYAAELVGLGADVIVAYSPLGVFAVQDQSRAIPIVFISVGDPVGTALLIVWQNPVETLPELRILALQWVGSGSNC
jgi:putative ABC transport system substrate-binding protein